MCADIWHKSFSDFKAWKQKQDAKAGRSWRGVDEMQNTRKLDGSKSYMKGYHLLRSASVPAGYALYLAKELSSEQKTITSVFRALDGFVEYTVMEGFPSFRKTPHFF